MLYQTVQRAVKCASVIVQIGPEVQTLITRTMQLPIAVAVKEEGSESSGIDVVGDGDQVFPIELKVLWILVDKLPDTVEHLYEYRRYLVILARILILPMSTTQLELMAKGTPFLLNESLKAFNSSVVRV